MTSENFAHWLSGFLNNKVILNGTDTNTLKAKLNEVLGVSTTQPPIQDSWGFKQVEWRPEKPFEFTCGCGTCGTPSTAYDPAVVAQLMGDGIVTNLHSPPTIERFIFDDGTEVEGVTYKGPTCPCHLPTGCCPPKKKKDN